MYVTRLDFLQQQISCFCLTNFRSAQPKPGLRMSHFSFSPDIHVSATYYQHLQQHFISENFDTLVSTYHQQHCNYSNILFAISCVSFMNYISLNLTT